mmetsp:Transcript_36442/g.67878  ORF Transcript_36442/g.67878 Transcript_36442/m.67878 type:complete len:346 (-) Transcript_36442:118-1155(-)
MFSRQFVRLAARTIPKTGQRMLSTQMGRKTMAKSPLVMLIVSGVAGGAMLMSESAADTVDIKAVKSDIAAAIDAEFERRGDGTSMAGTLVRLAWHASGTYSKEDGTGGSNGATMRFPAESVWGANAGLGCARDFLEPIKKKYPSMSYADLWTLAGATAIEEMGGPSIPWRGGRTDSDKPTTVPDGRLPAADSGCVAADVKHLRDIFHRMGFDDKEIVCLAGAHAVGRCHENASGYWGPWTNAETTFSNEYFRLLLEEKWTPKKTHNGKKWTGPAQLEDPSGKLMMLPADMSLVRAPEFRPYVEAYAKDEELFFKDFAAAFSKLLSLGVKFPEEKKKGFFSNLFGF